MKKTKRNYEEEKKQGKTRKNYEKNKEKRGKIMKNKENHPLWIILEGSHSVNHPQ